MDVPVQPQAAAATSVSRPTVIFDGDCGFCRRWVARWQALTQNRVEYLPYQEAGQRFREFPIESFRKAVHLIQPNGRITRGALAVLEILAISGRRWPLELYEDMPLLARASEWGYGVVAGHRDLFNKLDLAILGSNTNPVTYQATRRWFLRLLSIVYICAFISLWGQILGLIGSKGILPIAPQLHGLSSGEGGTPYLQMPTLFWINASDGMLVGVCAAGVAMAVMMLLRIVPVFAAFGAWLCYLSLTVAGQAFLAFQWDGLLLEAGFLAIFLSPLQLLPRDGHEPRVSRIVVWLYRWLLFRLMLLAGLVKWLGDDPNWRNFSALRYHFWTQPLPTWTAWYVNLLPAWIGFLGVAVTFFVEMIVPFFFFAPRGLRRWAFAFTVGFQVLIALTGNYGFFNLLTIILCIMLLDDTVWPFRIKRDRRFILTRPPEEGPTPIARLLAKIPPSLLIWLPWLRVPLAIFLIFVTTIEAMHRVRYSGWIPDWAMQTTASVGAFRSTNPYGLFEMMTTRRPEIIVEGSQDGIEWKAYIFKWKPGDVHRAPAFCSPHMPRLDWNMWFAGLSMEHDEMPRWFVQFLRRLLEASPEVSALLEENPFHDHAPKFVRATVYYYKFTTGSEVGKDGAWWTRNKTDYTTGAIMLGPSGELTKGRP